MGSERDKRIARLEEALGYSFRSRDLLDRALTHASAVDRSGADNERLEFLGDRVLGLAVADLLGRRFPHVTEGMLARRYNRLVNGTTCARIARRIGVGPALIIAASEAGQGGRNKDTILADACEALLGALFLEAGFPRTSEMIARLWGNELDDLADVGADADAKTALQELAQGQGLPLPEYFVLERSGPDHAPRFVVEVRIRDREAVQGVGGSKRAAEQAAAQAMLERSGARRPTDAA